MLANSTSCKKTLAEDCDPIMESVDLIDALARVINECPVCLAKLRKLKVGVNQTPTNSTADTPTST